MKKMLFAFAISALVFSCRTAPPLPKEKELVTITKVVTEYKHDTLITVKADSSFYEALVDCQNGKAVLRTDKNSKALSNSKSKKEGLQKPIVTIDKDGRLKVRCDYFENLYKITLKEKQVLERKLTEKTIVPPPKIIEKPLSWFQKLEIWFGRIAFLVLIIYLITKIPWRVSLTR